MFSNFVKHKGNYSLQSLQGKLTSEPIERSTRLDNSQTGYMAILNFDSQWLCRTPLQSILMVQLFAGTNL